MKPKLAKNIEAHRPGGGRQAIEEPAIASFRRRGPLCAQTLDDLIANYYGKSENLFNEPATTEELFASYYGSPQTKRRRNANRKPAVVLSLSCDDGCETLTQRRGKRYRPEIPVYNARPRYSTAKSFEDEINALAAKDVSPAREIEVDFAPASATGETPPALPKPIQDLVPPKAEPAFPVPPAEPTFPVPPAEPTFPVPPADPLSGAKPADPKASKAASTDDELAADLKAILSGQKIFDPVSGKTVEKSRVAEARSAQQSFPPPPPPNNDSQAIFDRIAQSMQHANAFDLGTVELKNRFTDFDRMADLRRRAEEEKRASKNRATTQPASPPKPPPKPDGKDFLEDLDAIRNQKAAPAEPSVAQGLSLPGDVAEALYDAGEHVLAAETLYPDKFVFGPAPSVKFSYGEIIALGDMFETPDKLNTCPIPELEKLKKLVVDSTNYHKSGRKTGKEVTNVQWDTATAGRYIPLSENNYDHFAPNILFKGAPFAKATPAHGNHKSSWESNHKRALEESKKDPGWATAGHFPRWPLLINAFADHFLTDAFAAGHLVNKEAIVDYYKASFYTGGVLTADGKTFFEKVAAKTFTGDVQKKFSLLETVATHSVGPIAFHPNIDSASRFASLLSGIAEKEPDRIGNMAIKALHDKINKDGVEVNNPAGSGPWNLTGDGYLTAKTLGIMRQAVQQSVANVLDPALRTAATIDFPAYFKKVWDYVPVLTSASETTVKTWTEDYVKPTSTVLIDAASALITLEVDTLTKVLIDRKILQKA